MNIAYISHPTCELHDMGSYHPEQPARLSAINDRLIASGLDMALQRYDASAAQRDQLLHAHSSRHVDHLFAQSPEIGSVSVDPDTTMNPYSLQAALLAAGAVIQGVDLVMGEKTRQVFCGVRPPGHHAERDKAMGFCLFNNIAVGAYHALEHHGLERVAIVDFDVHHGNGTEDIVAGDERILFCSTFQHPFYPHSGEACEAANVVNSPLPAGSDGESFRAAVNSHWLPALEAFAPQLIFISAGFDAHQADPLADFQLVDEDFAWVTRQLCQQALASADGRIVSSLEGGYDLHALARSVEAHLKALLGDD
ncbi:histone deacetylase [Halioglobus japonicus]|uniref:Deacetylase n=1 Tax=Halioglobus japonicus TaxID=930805 RepID=A0AAP8MDY5_9GAMM|nr:histone deacetylase family protein [Halioglobus japonicus]PLW86037.1 deacetylase [Halioglobus japonicus]GHD14808.1 histone deacetylase [Halioglobus japonicus]